MKILTGATGVLGSHIMYEILELFINTKIDGKLFIIARNKGKNCSRSHKRTIIE
jgi:thioester reductase-like protein